MKKRDFLYKYFIKAVARVMIALIFFTSTGCNKLIHINEPVNTITSSEVFSSDGNANSAVAAIYSDMSYGGGGLNYANGGITIMTGESSDELNDDNGSYTYYHTNALLPTDGSVYNYFWAPIYTNIYRTNAVINGVQSSTVLTAGSRQQFDGEAKFLRAFSYFYMVNLFGDVPLALSTNWANTDTMQRTSQSLVYKQIIADLTDAQKELGGDYSFSNGNRIRANKWAATALLARAYLYAGDWKDAEAQATSVINSGAFHLVTDLDSAFLINNDEAIWQLQVIDQYPYATQEGNQFIPPDNNSSVNTSISQELLVAFEPNDNRKQMWIDSSNYSGTIFYYPFKFKVRQGDPGSETEYYTLLRLAEQFLIRAEAKAMENTDLLGAIQDLNVIRERAGLADLPATLNQSDILTAIYQERRVELFCEWGHRWFDLKRTGKATEVLAPLKPTWASTATLYPIPQQEIIADHNLKQNDGYK